MPETNEEYRQRIIRMSEERGEFVTDVDGYIYFWPRDGGGHLAAHHLRWLADELDSRNEIWDRQISDYFSRSSNEEQPSPCPQPVDRHRSCAQETPPGESLSSKDPLAIRV